ncbi:MAG: phosphoribosyl-ATP diphosphatase [Rhodospirillales bacterium]|nr:phosphoribosyl-ATP diphosphatase [Rhodospirillales bacterium]
MARTVKKGGGKKPKPEASRGRKPGGADKKKPRKPVLPEAAPSERRAPGAALPPLAIGPGEAVLERLFAVVQSRRDADPAVSHSARLLARGPAKVAQKFGEEAVECLIEAATGNRDALVAESADVLYHLIVVWVSAGVTPDAVWAELKRREGVSGIAEKASRAKSLPLAFGVETTKIP